MRSLTSKYTACHVRPHFIRLLATRCRLARRGIMNGTSDLSHTHSSHSGLRGRRRSAVHSPRRLSHMHSAPVAAPHHHCSQPLGSAFELALVSGVGDAPSAGAVDAGPAPAVSPPEVAALPSLGGSVVEGAGGASAISFKADSSDSSSAVEATFAASDVATAELLPMAGAASGSADGSPAAAVRVAAVRLTAATAAAASSSADAGAADMSSSFASVAAATGVGAAAAADDGAGGNEGAGGKPANTVAGKCCAASRCAAHVVAMCPTWPQRLQTFVGQSRMKCARTAPQRRHT